VRRCKADGKQWAVLVALVTSLVLALSVSAVAQARERPTFRESHTAVPMVLDI
jgi:hypothetical protein